MILTPEQAAAVDRRRRCQAGENRYRVMMPERYDDVQLIGQWTESDEREFVNRLRIDLSRLADLALALLAEREGMRAAVKEADLYRKIEKQREHDELAFSASGQTYSLGCLTESAARLDNLLSALGINGRAAPSAEEFKP